MASTEPVGACSISAEDQRATGGNGNLKALAPSSGKLSQLSKSATPKKAQRRTNSPAALYLLQPRQGRGKGWKGAGEAWGCKNGRQREGKKREGGESKRGRGAREGGIRTRAA